MIEEVKKDDSTINDIRDIVTKEPDKDNVLTLTKVVEAKEENSNNTLLEDINSTLSSFEIDSKAGVREMIKQLKRDKEVKRHKNDTSLESLVISLLDPKIDQWLNENLPSIVKEAVERKLNKIVEDD